MANVGWERSLHGPGLAASTWEHSSGQKGKTPPLKEFTSWWTTNQQNKEIKMGTPVTGKCGDRNKTQRCNSIRMGRRGKDSIRKDGQGSLSEEVTCGPRPEY